MFCAYKPGVAPQRAAGWVDDSKFGISVALLFGTTQKT